MSDPGDMMGRFRRALDEEMEHLMLTSALAAWMDTHHDQAAEVLAHKRLDSAKAAKAFANSGMKDHLGQPPTAETARETWNRVEERRRAGTGPRAPITST